MELHNVIPGSAEWLALRAQPNTYTASEAPAMMGASKYMTRSELLHQKHTGITPDVDSAKQRLFDAGHDAEAAFRPIAEEIIGDELYPCTGSVEIDGMRLLASFDGLTMDRKTGMEHKLRNENIAEAILTDGEPGPAYYWQLEHQLLVSGADEILFATSDGTSEGATYCWYQSKPKRRAALIAGWKQFAEDLKAYVPPAASAVEKIVAEPVEALPAPVVKVTGQIALVDNLKAFEERLREFLAEKLIREPKTDEDFVNLDAQIKAMKSAREALKAAEAQMLAQVQPVDQAKKTKDMLDKLLQQNVSMAEGILDAEKARRKGEIVAVGVKGLADHIASLNQRLGKPYMPNIPADFGGCIKGLKSLTSMEDKVATELARAKIAASEIADKIERNLTWLRENAQDYAGLFADTATLVLKAHDDFVAIAQNRITTEKARVQAEHERIAAEAAAAARKKLLDEHAAMNEMALQEIQGIQQQVIIAQSGRLGVRKGGTIECIRETLAETEAWTITEERFGTLVGAAQAAKDRAINDIRALLVEAENKAAAPALAAAVADAVTTGTGVLKQTANAAGGVALAHVPAAAIRVNPVPPAANDDARIKLGDINSRIAPLSITADGLAELGFPHVGTAGSAKLYRESDYPRICEALIQHLTQVADLQAA